MTESPSTTALSKREQKRQAKLAKSLAEQEKDNGLQPVDPANGAVLPVLDDDLNKAASSAETKRSPYIEPVQKRIRNYLKKKQKIDQLSDRAKNPEEAKSLNKDQLEILARKDQVLAPLKELQNLSEQFVEIENEQKGSLQAEAAELNRSKSTAVAAAKEEGLKEGKKIVTSLIAFLGYASLLRITPTADSDFNEATEQLLNIVYLGGDDSLAAAESLDAASETLIDGTDVSFKRIYEAIYKSSENPQESDAIDDKDNEAHNGDYHAEVGQDNHGLQGSNFITLSEASKTASIIPSGGISFLNESEIEGTHQSESLAEPLQDEVASAPTQTLADIDGNQAATGDVDWSSSAPRSNWADDESTDAPVADSTPAIAAADDVPSKGAIQKPDLHSIDEFKTVEKKAPVRDGRGRGRGSGRGRGDRGSGRGRGEGRGKPRGQSIPA